MRSIVGKNRVLARWQWKGKFAATLVFAGLLSGCSTSSGLCDSFGPSQSASVDVPSGASAQKVFACLDEATSGKGDRPEYAGKGKATRDLTAGVYETDQYRASNVSGFRLKAELSKKTPSTLTLTLRGAGAYCADLGVNQEMARLKADVSACLQR